MRITDTSDVWWKNAVVYCVDVRRFLDLDGDGEGDLAGLAHRIDYLADLGITCLWLQPFYPSPRLDNGYDITDFYGVDPATGSLGRLVEVVRTARDRGIRVIADLVVNHTSTEHPWFRSARSSPDSPYRDWYVWRDAPPAGAKEVEVFFPDQEEGIWRHDEEAGQYYLHRFYRHQPDLNVANPDVREEISRVMGFWLQMGMCGFRVDAVPYVLDTVASDGIEGALADPHLLLRDMRAFLSRRSGEGVLLGEVNRPYEEQARYFGGEHGAELSMVFDFPLNQRLYLALARRDARVVGDTVTARPPVGPDDAWATFVRNHDELTLDQLTDAEREEVFAAFGPEEEMQIFGRGLRRRLPPMLDGDPRRIRMVYSLVFSLPGTPVLYYGEEIGMGEDLGAEGREAVRSPMQWNGGRNGGFSVAEADRLVAPVVDGPFGPEHVNAEDQRRDPDSLLTFMTRLVRRYRECPELGWGEVQVLDQPCQAVLAHRCTWQTGSTLAVHNLGPEPRTVPLQVDGCGSRSRLVDVLRDGETCTDEEGRVEISLEGYGYRWLRVVHEGEQRLT
jgi:trehalose synthase